MFLVGSSLETWTMVYICDPSIWKPGWVTYQVVQGKRTGTFPRLWPGKLSSQGRPGTVKGEVPLRSNSVLRVRIEKVMTNTAGNTGKGEISGWSLDLILKGEKPLKDLQSDIIQLCILKASFWGKEVKLAAGPENCRQRNQLHCCAFWGRYQMGTAHVMLGQINQRMRSENDVCWWLRQLEGDNEGWG